MALAHSPKIITNGLLLSIDFANTKNYPGTGSIISPTVSNNTLTLLNNSYYTYSNGTVQFTRTTAPAAKDGGGAIGTLSGNLAVSNFLYNDHTWEVWFRIDDVTGGNYDGTEPWSTLNLYSGYHAGFMYSSTAMYYLIWDGITTGRTCLQWTLGTSGTQIIQGNWYQIVAVRSGTTFTPYLNGVQLGTSFTVSLSATGIGTSNNFCFGKSQNLAAGAGSYLYYGKNTIGNTKLYNKSLTGTEVNQNFNALRGRYGL